MSGLITIGGALGFWGLRMRNRSKIGVTPLRRDPCDGVAPWRSACIAPSQLRAWCDSTINASHDQLCSRVLRPPMPGGRQLAKAISSREQAFTHVFSAGLWSGSGAGKSGGASDLNATSCLRPALIDILEWIGIEKAAGEPIQVLDAPCGDLQWIPTLWDELRARHTGDSKPRSIKYMGIDIVKPLIDSHRRWSTEVSTLAWLKRRHVSMSFDHHDVVEEALKQSYDLIHTKDMMIHLTNRDALTVLKTFAESGSRWLMATTSPRLFTAKWHHPEWPPAARRNYDLGLSVDMGKMLAAGSPYQQHGNGRDVDLERPPYNLPPPLCRSMQFPPMRAQMNLWDLHIVAEHLNVSRRHDGRRRKVPRSAHSPGL